MRASLTCRHPQAPLYFTRITPDSSAINATKRGTKSDFLPFITKGGVTPAPVPVSVSVFWPSSNSDTGTGTFALVSLVPVLALVPAPSQQKEPLYCVKNLQSCVISTFPSQLTT